MTDGHKQAILLAIGKKLEEADLRIQEAKKIFDYYTNSKRREGLYPGQLDNLVDPEDTIEEACLE